MTTLQVEHRLRIHDAETSTPSDGTVAFTLTDLADIPQFGGQLIEPTKGTSRLGRWSFRAIDTAEILTGNLANASGRAHLIGRLAEIQERRNSGAWTTVNVGRLTALNVEEGRQASYLVEVRDERWVEANSRIFQEADTAYLWPAGLRFLWKDHPARFPADSVEVLATSGNRVRVKVFSHYPVSTLVEEWIRKDLIDDPVQDRNDGEGNFEHLRARIDGTDYKVLSFGSAIDGTDFLEGLQQTRKAGAELRFWIHAPGGVGSPSLALLWAPTAPPSETLPLHVGTIASGHVFGFPNPWELVPALYDEAGVRYDAAAFTALAADPGTPLCGWRVTNPDLDLATFVEEQIYAPLGVIPFVDDAGRVSPRSVRLPAAEDFDPDDAFTLDADNCAAAPSFDHAEAEVVNQIVVEGRRHRRIESTTGSADGQIGAPAQPVRTDFPADYMTVEETLFGPVDYESTTTELGRRKQTFRAHGFVGTVADPLDPRVRWLIEETFDRFGDGPVWGKVRALRTPQDGLGRTPEDLEAGDLVKLDFSTWPNMATNSRGGIRIVQIMSKRPGPQGIEYEFLDVGPSLQPLPTPTLSVAQNSGNPRHAIDVTIGALATGARAQIRIGYGASGDLTRRDDALPGGATSVSEGHPSGSQVRVQVRQIAPGRVPSAWSSTDSASTATLPAPTGLSATVLGRAVKLEFTPAAAGYPIMPVYRTAGGGAWTDARSVALPPGTKVYVFPALAASTAYDWGVRHVDRFGGLGTVASVQATTDSEGRTLGAPRFPQIVQGRSEGGTEDLPPEELWVGVGLHVRFTPAELGARTIVQVALADDFAAIAQTVELSAGVSEVLIQTEQLDDDPRFVRLLHRRAGFEDSDVSSIVSARPTGLLSTEVADTFAGGIGSLRALPDGRLEATISDGGDVSTDRAYYAFVVNPDPEEFPDVDDTSDFVERADFPWVEILQDEEDPPEDIVVQEGDVVLMHVRFWNAVTGFGQDLLIRLEVYLAGGYLIVLEEVEWVRSYTLPPAPLLTSVVGRLHLRVGPRVASVHSELITSAGGPFEADKDLTPTNGIVELIIPQDNSTSYNFYNQIAGMRTLTSLDLTPYDDVGGAGGTGQVGDIARLLENVLPGQHTGAMRAFLTDDSGDDASGFTLKYGTDGRGDGVFEVEQAADGPVLKLRDTHDATTVSGTWTPDYRNGASQKVTLTGNTALQIPSNWGTGRPMNLLIDCDGNALSFAAGFYLPDGIVAADLAGLVLLTLVELDSTPTIAVGALNNLQAA